MPKRRGLSQVRQPGGKGEYGSVVCAYVLVHRAFHGGDAWGYLLDTADGVMPSWRVAGTRE